MFITRRYSSFIIRIISGYFIYKFHIMFYFVSACELKYLKLEEKYCICI